MPGIDMVGLMQKAGIIKESIMKNIQPAQSNDKFSAMVNKVADKNRPVSVDPDPILQSIYSKYPAFKNMGKVTLKADPNFTRDKTGAGDIEYFPPNTADGRNTIIYDNKFEYAHPKPGTHGIVYNPQNNGEQAIMLDMIHGMSVDPVFSKHRQEFAQAMYNKYGDDMEREWADYNKETNGENDGKESFKSNWIDGQIRALMFEGNSEDFKKANYWEGARNLYLQDPKIKETFTQIQNYLKTGQGYTLPEVEIKATK
jgi:hypothetical protein